jgi:regulator of replication initiation timing
VKGLENTILELIDENIRLMDENIRLALENVRLKGRLGLPEWG